jgi:hypothetical protein
MSTSKRDDYAPARTQADQNCIDGCRLQRRIEMSSRLAATLRYDVSNLPNRTSFGNPNADITATNRVPSGRAARGGAAHIRTAAITVT